MFNHEEDLSEGLTGRLPDARRIVRASRRSRLTTTPTSFASCLCARTWTLPRSRRHRFEFRALAFSSTLSHSVQPGSKDFSLSRNCGDVLDDSQDCPAVIAGQVPDLRGDRPRVFASGASIVAEQRSQRIVEQIGDLWTQWPDGKGFCLAVRRRCPLHVRLRPSGDRRNLAYGLRQGLCSRGRREPFRLPLCRRRAPWASFRRRSAISRSGGLKQRRLKVPAFYLRLNCGVWPDSVDCFQ